MRRSFSFLSSLALALALAACGPSAGAKRAQSFLDRGDYPGAAQAADGELGKSPSDAALHRIRLRAALGMGDARGAVEHYRAWRAGKGDDLPGLRTMAMTTLWQGLRSSSAALTPGSPVTAPRSARRWGRWRSSTTRGTEPWAGTAPGSTGNSTATPLRRRSHRAGSRPAAPTRHPTRPSSAPRCARSRRSACRR